MKRCSKCGEHKPESDFYKDKRTPDGLKCQCKKCHIATSVITRDNDKKRESNMEYMRRAFLSDPDKFRDRWRLRKRPKDEHVIARALLNQAVKKREVIKPPKCQECGSESKVTAHHSDYNKPYDVEWLCTKCHGLRSRISFERCEKPEAADA